MTRVALLLPILVLPFSGAGLRAVAAWNIVRMVRKKVSEK